MYGQRFVGKEVIVHGWYRRFGSPFVEISHFECPATGEKVRSYMMPVALVFNVLVAVGFACLTLILSR